MKDIIKKGLFYSGFYKLYCYLRASDENRLLILMYHDIVEDNMRDMDNDIWAGKPSRSQFAAHLAVFKKYYRVVSVEQAIDEIKREGRLQQDSVAITFDDGYASAYHIAFPLLKKYKFPATIYPITDWINRKMSPWWEDLADMVRKCDFNNVAVGEVERILGSELAEIIKDLTGRPKLKRVFRKGVEAILRQKDDDELSEIMYKLKILMFSDSDYAPEEVSALSWEEIKEMADCGIEFGAHTCSHINLSHVDMELAEKEIVESRREINKRLAKKVKGFAYPYGMDLIAYRRTEPILKKHKFEYACTSFPGNTCAFSNRYALRRTTLPPLTSKALLGRILYLDFAASNKVSKSAKTQNKMKESEL